MFSGITKNAFVIPVQSHPILQMIYYRVVCSCTPRWGEDSCPCTLQVSCCPDSKINCKSLAHCQASTIHPFIITNLLCHLLIHPSFIIRLLLVCLRFWGDWCKHTSVLSSCFAWRLKVKQAAGEIWILTEKKTKFPGLVSQIPQIPRIGISKVNLFYPHCLFFWPTPRK